MSASGVGHIAGDDEDLWQPHLDVLDRAVHAFGMAVRRRA